MNKKHNEFAIERDILHSITAFLKVIHVDFLEGCEIAIPDFFEFFVIAFVGYITEIWEVVIWRKFF